MKRIKPLFNLLAGTSAPLFARIKPRKLILCYHRFSSNGRVDPFFNASTTTPIADLEQQILWLKTFCNFKSLRELIGSSTPQTKWDVSITIDDGYQDVIDLALPLFEKHQIPVTWFITTGPIQDSQEIPWWDLSAFLNGQTDAQISVHAEGISKDLDLSIAEDLRWLQHTLRETHLFGALDQAKELKQQVIAQLAPFCEIPRNSFARPESLKDAARSEYLSLAPHTVTHSNLAQLHIAEQEQEIKESLETLKNWGLQPENVFSYPFGKSWARNEDTLSILRNLGFDASFTTESGFMTDLDHPYLIPRISVDGRWDIQAFKARVTWSPLLKKLKTST